MIKKYVFTLAVIMLFAAFAESVQAQEMDQAKRQSMEAAADVEAVEASYDDAEGGRDTSQEELQAMKSDFSNRTDQYRQSVRETQAQIKKLQSEQTANAKQTAKLAKEIDRMNSESKKLERNESLVRAQAEKVNEKTVATRKTHEEVSTKHTQNLAELKLAKADFTKIQNDLKSAQRELQASLKKEKMSSANLAKSEANLKKWQTMAAVQSKQIDQKIKIALMKADKNEKRASLNEQRLQQAQEKLKLKRQRLSEAQEKQKRSLGRLSQANNSNAH